MCGGRGATGRGLRRADVGDVSCCKRQQAASSESKYTGSSRPLPIQHHAARLAASTFCCIKRCAISTACRAAKPVPPGSAGDRSRLGRACPLTRRRTQGANQLLLLLAGKPPENHKISPSKSAMGQAPTCSPAHFLQPSSHPAACSPQRTHLWRAGDAAGAVM